VFTHDVITTIAGGYDLAGSRGAVAPVDAGGPVKHVWLGRLEHGHGDAAEGLVLEARQPILGPIDNG
jgi:hypothetical protein